MAVTIIRGAQCHPAGGFCGVGGASPLRVSHLSMSIYQSNLSIVVGKHCVRACVCCVVFANTNVHHSAIELTARPGRGHDHLEPILFAHFAGKLIKHTLIELILTLEGRGRESGDDPDNQDLRRGLVMQTGTRTKLDGKMRHRCSQR